MEIDEHQVPDNEMGFEGLDWCADTGVMNIYVGEGFRYPSKIYVCVDGIERLYQPSPAIAQQALTKRADEGTTE